MAYMMQGDHDYYEEMDHGESIYKLIPPTIPARVKPPKHVSKHDPKVPPTASTFNTKGSTVGAVSNVAGDATTKPVPDKSGRTFGKAPGSLAPDPQNRMTATKNVKVESLSEVKKNNPDLLQPSQLKTKTRPVVPKASEAPVMNLVSQKNYIVANAVSTILAAPKKVSDGARDYLNKDDYGRTPAYLNKVKQDIEDEHSYIRNLQLQQEEAARAKVRHLDDSEREGLIVGLKSKWEQVNSEYQSMAHLTKLDTVGKIRRKEQMEARLSQIEKDIEKLSKKNILVHAEF
jgi:hypothetical protein